MDANIATEYSKKVYKKDTKGKIRILHVYTEGSVLIQESGLVDGEKVKHQSTCIGKNIGKANETTPEEQAQSEAASKVSTKMSTGYFDTVKEAESNEVILPMLAKDFNKEKKKIDWTNAYAQPKLDGMRSHGKKEAVIMSRKGKEILTMPHIQVDLDTLITPDIIDGELYAHGFTFQENMKAIKKIRPEALDGCPASTDVKFHVYDMVSKTHSFRHRYDVLSMLVSNMDNIELVPTYRVTSEKELEDHHQQFLAEGYEGTILRWGDAGYKVNGRSSNLLKYKDFIDIACKVIDVKPCKKRPEQGECVCEHNGKTFGTGMKFSHKEREEILLNKQNYIGQTAEIRFFEYTDDGIPRFPVCVGFRLDK